MAETCPYPLFIEGDWSSANSNTVKNKLQIYFQSKKKSNGGDCRVEYEDTSRNHAVVWFKNEERSRISFYIIMPSLTRKKPTTYLQEIESETLTVTALDLSTEALRSCKMVFQTLLSTSSLENDPKGAF
ncbi:UNVERIFIED_CONTAM: hypothetical protein FKN15_033511 [Acipenser sinensis]